MSLFKFLALQFSRLKMPFKNMLFERCLSKMKLSIQRLVFRHIEERGIYVC